MADHCWEEPSKKACLKCKGCSSMARQNSCCMPQRILSSGVKPFTKDRKDLLQLFILVKYGENKLLEIKG